VHVLSMRFDVHGSPSPFVTLHSRGPSFAFRWESCAREASSNSPTVRERGSKSKARRGKHTTPQTIRGLNLAVECTLTLIAKLESSHATRLITLLFGRDTRGDVERTLGTRISALFHFAEQ
jgi:hypothetical protein